MLTVDEIEAIADSLTPAMRHVILRCSEGGWQGEELGYPRTWMDVVYGRPNVSFRGTVHAIEKRGLVAIIDKPGVPNMVALTMEGHRVQAALRLRK